MNPVQPSQSSSAPAGLPPPNMSRKRRDYHRKLYASYIAEQGWKIEGNPSGFFIHDGGLYDRHASHEVVYALASPETDEVYFGFRIVDAAADVRLHHCTVPTHILDDSIESNRFVLVKELRGFSLSLIAGKILFDYCRAHDRRYAVLVSRVHTWREQFYRVPGLKVYRDACRYPEESQDVFVFDSKNLFLRFYFWTPVYSVLFGSALVRRMLKKIQRLPK